MTLDRLFTSLHDWCSPRRRIKSAKAQLRKLVSISNDLAEELDVLGGDGEAVSAAEPGRWFHVLHIVRRLVEVFQQFLQQTGGKALLCSRSSDTSLASVLVSRCRVLACSRYLLTVTANNESLKERSQVK